MGRRDAGGTLGRRGVLAGAAALVAGGLAKLAGPGRADAGHNGTTAYAPEGVLHLDVNNTTDGATRITRASSSVSTNAFAVENDVGNAISALATSDGSGLVGRTTVNSQFAEGTIGIAPSDGIGVRGAAGTNEDVSRGGIGVVGTSTSFNATGVVGISAFLGFAPVPIGRYGVIGVADVGDGMYGSVVGAGNGVRGGANSGSGVRGEATTGSGVRGEATTGSGLRGLSGDGNGVFGVSTNASGVYGFSGNSFGAAGVSNGGVGVYASSGSNWALHATSPVFAGVFSGAVFVNGSFTVANGAKSAAVRNKRGEHRRVYCQESTEPWFEDFGEATLANGHAVVPLDPEFDAVVKGDDYRVFLTEVGDCGGLFVSRKGPHRFEVRSRAGNAASGSFDYRVVARRLDDVGRRLEKVDAPEFSKVRRPVPPPDLPTAPERPSR